MPIETIEGPPISNGYVFIELEETDAGWMYGYAVRLQYIARASYEDWTRSGHRRRIECGPERSRRDALYNAAACIRVLLPQLGWDTGQHNRTKQTITAWLDEIAPVQTDLFGESNDRTS